MAVRRGLMILALAYLFRLQSWVISGGTFPGSLLKVDILNVMGVSMVGAAVVWRIGWNERTRAVMFAVSAVVIAMATPLVRAAPSLAALPDALESYVRPIPGRATFTLLPWSAFLVAGAAVGVWLDAARDTPRERRMHLALLVMGLLLGVVSYGASFLPALYDQVSFWTTSPAFFFLRLGVLLAVMPIAYALSRAVRATSLETFGRASLFVYWIHVEMAYGVLSLPLHRRLSLEQLFLAQVAFCVLLFGLVKLKARVVARITNPERNQTLGSSIEPTLPNSG
jgi:uncharacterized membrane protein